MSTGNDEAGAHEEGNLHYGVSYKVEVGTLYRQRRQERGTQHDVGKLTDGGESEASLQMVLTEGDEGGYQHGAGRRPGNEINDIDFRQKLWTEDEADDTKYAEYAGLNNCYRMEQCGYRCGGNHSGREPAVERHDCSLYGAGENHQHEDCLKHPAGSHSGIQEAAGGEAHGTGDAVDRNDAHQEKLTGNKSIDEVFPAGRESVLISLMENQRIAGESQQLVEYKEGQEVFCHGDTHDSTHAESKGGEVAGLLTLLITAHIADGVEVHGNPQHGGKHCEYHAGGVGAEGEAHGICQLAEGVGVNISGENAR